MQQFFERIWLEQQQKKSFLCVGLDPNLERIPGHLGKGSEAVFEFLRQIVDATLPFASCYKPQIAYFSGQGLEECLLQTISYIRAESPTTPIILDAKRNDIGATAEMYAREAFERYGADAVTLNPYMGEDSIEPYAAFKDRGLFILCRTSNPGAREFQNLMVGEDGPLYQFVAQRALGDWNKNNNIGLVVGATAIKELKKIRTQFPEAWFLVPGIGAQGGDLASVIEYGRRVDGQGGLVINAARSILYASDGEDFAGKAGDAAKELQQEMAKSF